MTRAKQRAALMILMRKMIRWGMRQIPRGNCPAVVTAVVVAAGIGLHGQCCWRQASRAKQPWE